MEHADVALDRCYDLRCLLWKSSINKAFEHWEGAMAELFWPDYRAAAGSRIRSKNADFRLTGQNASPLAYAQNVWFAGERLDSGKDCDEID